MLLHTAAQLATIMIMTTSVGCAATSGDRATTPTPAADATRAPDATSAETADGPAAAEPTRDALTVDVPEPVAAWSAQMSVAAQRHGVPIDLVALVVWIESRGNPDAVSSAGARGLMQLMPTTAAAVADRHGRPVPTPAQMHDVETNLDLGAALLADLIADYAAEGLDVDGVERVAIAYNGGPGVLAAWKRGEALPNETERYAARMRERWAARLASNAGGQR